MDKLEIIKSINEDKEKLKEIFYRINENITKLDDGYYSFDEMEELIQFYLSSLDLEISMRLK